MAIEGPILTSIIARLPDHTINLAAYGVTVALAMFIEAPVIMLLSTTVALAHNQQSIRKLSSFTKWINLVVTVAMVVTSLPPVYDLIVNDIIRLAPDISASMYWAFVCMIPWPAAIGFRRFAQGVMIKQGQTRRVTIGTIVRLIAMLGCALLLMSDTKVPGVIVGAASLTFGVVAEAIATYYMARTAFKSFYSTSNASDNDTVLTSADILRFYIPLAMTSIIGFVVTPMLAFFMNRAPMPLASLAVLPVVDSFVFLFRSFGFSYQEVGIALLGRDKSTRPALQLVGMWIGLCTTIAVTLISFTPLLNVVYGTIYGLSPDLQSFAHLPTQILIVLPAIAVSYSVQRSILISVRKTMSVTISTLVEVGCILVIMTSLVLCTSIPGAISAAIAMSAGRILATTYLIYQVRKLRF